MTDAKEKDAFSWAGSLCGGGFIGDGLAGVNENMPDLARRLSRRLGRPILDHTALNGSYDFRVEYHSDEERPDIITMILTSVQELGLKLEASKGRLKP